MFNKLGGLEGAQAFLRDEKTVTKAATPALLSLVTPAPVEVQGEFRIADFFKTKKTPDGVHLYWIGDNFQERFGKHVESGIAEASLKFHALKRFSLDAPILAELGEEAQETKLAYLWELLKKQPKGEKGLLLVNGYANIFYVRDDEGTLWAVGARWISGGGWRVEAYSVENSDRWDDGDQVVSR